MRRVLWLAGIALRDMPLERVAPFEVILGRKRVHLGATFDASEELAIHIGHHRNRREPTTRALCADALVSVRY